MAMASISTQNSVVQPLLTDLYQITMAYAYWKNGRQKDMASFDLFFRKNPFGGEFTIFSGLSDILNFLKNFKYSSSDLTYLSSVLADSVEPEFFEYLAKLTPADIVIYSLDEGSIVFPRVPILRIEGPLIIAQLLETTLLNLVNFASLVTTNAARFRIAADRSNIKLYEFGLRRAQGPDGGLTASKYAYIGGFDGTSNVLAGKLYNIPVKGTHGHAYITSFSGPEDLTLLTLNINSQEDGRKNIDNWDFEEKRKINDDNFYECCLSWRIKCASLLKLLEDEASNGELAAFVSFAIAFPKGFLALVDTYDVTRSGLLNFVSVALGLWDKGYRALGIRIDSGDLAYLSSVARDTFASLSVELKESESMFSSLIIIVSNDINEETILSLNDQGHSIDIFGIGTHLVTCQRQPALGCVYKLVEVNGKPRLKLSQDVDKMTLPGRKEAYRLYSVDGSALIDLLVRPNEEKPKKGFRVLCRHPFQESKRAWVIPSSVEALYKIRWRNGKVEEGCNPTLEEIRENVQKSLRTLRQDHKRSLNPTPYKVGVSNDLYHFIHDLWLENQPIGELS